ncbi:MAG: DUF3343 domain-containing protein [Candidatus Cloacimonadales bacterium]
MAAKKAVILFHSTNYAIWAENELKRNKIKCKMTNVPRSLSSDCGYCVEISASDTDKAEQIMRQTKIDFDSIQEI